MKINRTLYSHINIYYAIGERLSDIIKPHSFIKGLIKIILDAIVKKI